MQKRDSVTGRHIVIIACTLLVMTFITGYQHKKHDTKMDVSAYAYVHDKLEKKDISR